MVKSVAFNHAGALLASGSFDTRIILWDVSSPDTPVMTGIPLKKHTSFVNSLVFSPDDGTLISGGDDKQIVLWDVSAKRPEGQPVGQGHAAAVSAIAFGADGKKFASAGDDNVVMLWDWDAAARSLRNPKMFEGHEGYVRGVSFSGDGALLVSVGFDGHMILWDVEMGAQSGLPLHVHTRPVNAVSFGAASSGGFLFTGSDDRTVIMWDLSMRTPINNLEKNAAPPMGLGDTAVGAADVTARVEGERNIRLDGRDALLIGHTGAINSLAFSPREIDDKFLLASAGNDQTAILWNASGDATADSIFLKLDGFDNPVIKAYFDDGDLISIERSRAGFLGRSIRWNIDPALWEDLVCNAVTRNLNPDEQTLYLAGQPYAGTCANHPVETTP